jgi:hypothetical protein
MIMNIEPDKWRNFEMQKLLKCVLDNIAANPRSRPKSPSPDHERWGRYEYEALKQSLDPHRITLSLQRGRGEDETELRLLVVSIPVSEDPTSPHNVKRRSPLRDELVIVDIDSKEEDE